MINATRKATSYRSLVFAALLLSFVAAGCGGGDDDGGGGTQSPTTSSSPWLDESDFLRDPSLHAMPGQVVVLHLDATEPGADLVMHTIRYLVEETTDLTFCIPADEPHLKALELVTESFGESMLHAEPGEECVAVRIPPGAYELHIAHDGTNVPSGGIKAFLHHPQQRASSLSRAQLTNGGAAGVGSFSVPDFMAFTYGGKFVTDATASPLLALQPAVTSVDDHAVFRFSGGPTQYSMKDGTGATVMAQTSCGTTGTLFVGSSGASSAAQMFEFSEPSFGQFRFCAVRTSCGSSPACIDRQSSTNILQYNQNDTTGTIFTVDYKGYDCTTSCDSDSLQLEQGEVAVFAGENYTGPAAVFRLDVPKFSIYNSAASSKLAVGNDMVSSVRLGPDTFAILYQNGSYGGASVIVGEDTPSLAGTAVGNAAASSMHINAIDIHQYILETNGCENCVLPGIDLSGLDLTGTNFSGTRLSGANLSNTVLREATLDDATLSGSETILSATDFTFASLHCTDLSETDLTAASFGSLVSNLFVVDEGTPAILRTDPVTGDRTVVSGAGKGSGTSFVQPQSLAAMSDGNLIVTDESLPGVFRVDVSTGARTVVSSSSVGSGPTLALPTGVAIDANGQLLVVDGLAMLLRIDPSNGARTLVSGGSTGSGTAFEQPQAIVIDGNGQLIVADRGLRALLSVNPSTGARTILSDESTGSGPSFFRPVDVTIDAAGNLFVADLTLPGVFRVDPSSGNRVIVSGTNVGSGPGFVNVVSVAAAGDGTLFVTDQILGVVQVNIASGNRSVVSGSSMGGGPDNSSPAGLTLTSPLLALDFSCRLNASSATIDAEVGAETFPVGYWRYIDLTDAEILNATSAPLSTSDEPLDLSGAYLSGATGLTGVVLDGVNLNCATPSAEEKNCSQLIGTVLNEASMKGASAANAALNGAKLIHANLEQADLSGAQLLKSPTTSASAILDGAYLKNANLSEADLSGASFIDANWYGRGGLCDGGGWTGNCASGTGSTNLSNADFSGAYLAGLDLSGATAQETNFRGAILVGAHFNSANLSGDTNTGAFTHFNNAFLQGANFDSANTTAADFTGAYVDDESSSLELIFQLPSANLQFTGYTPPANPPECVVFSTSEATTTPEPVAGYTCPDGSNSPCSDWQCSTCVPGDDSSPPASVDGSFPGSCTHLDFNW